MLSYHVGTKDAYFMVEMAVEAMTMMVKLAAMKLIHSGVPPTITRQITAKASRKVPDLSQSEPVLFCAALPADEPVMARDQ